VISLPKKFNPDSPTTIPRKANIAIRPCFNSDSRYLENSLASSGQRDKGSKKPKGPDTPAWSLGLNAGLGATAGLGMMTLSITWMTP
jgi:hypothetical protein